MNFTQQEIAVIFQALCVTENYYRDPNAHIAGQAYLPADNSRRAERLAGLAPVMARIIGYAKDIA